MLTAEEFPEIIEDLTGHDTSMKSALLRVLWQHPSADERIIPYLSRLLYDKSPCLLSIPYLFGEIRWLAAHALAAERAALGIQKPVYLPRVVKPLDTGEIVKAEYAAGIKPRGGVDGLLINFAILNDMAYLPFYDLDLSYWIDTDHKACLANSDGWQVPLDAHTTAHSQTLTRVGASCYL